MPNGQMQPPQTWEEWIELLKKQIKQQEMSMELLKAQFAIAATHVKK